MKRNRNSDVIKSFDWVIFLSFMGLCLFGIVMMLDISSMQSSMSSSFRHIAYFIVSFISVMLILKFGNMEKLRKFNVIWIFVCIVLLWAVLQFGTNVKGGIRSLNFGFITVQPSFIARLVLVLYLAGFLASKQEAIREAKFSQLLLEFAPPIVFIITIYVLIFLERHLSTLIISGVSLFGMLIYAGLRKRFILLITVCGAVLVFLIITQGDEFRQSRMETYKYYNLFSNSRSELKDAPESYHTQESLIALTGGALLGTGTGKGRAKHYYLPEARTDYIYTVIGEEYGFIGAFIVLILQAMLFFRAFKIAHQQENPYYKYLCAGLAMNIFVNALVNTGVAMSIIPATGNTLPFVSYGGTALLMDSIAVGILLNISAKRRAV